MQLAALNKMHDIWFARMKSNFEAFWAEMEKRERANDSNNGVFR